MTSVALLQDRLGNGEANRTCRLQVDDEFELGGTLDRQLAGVGSSQDLVNVARRAPKQVRDVRPVGKQPADARDGGRRRHRRPAVLCRKLHNPRDERCKECGCPEHDEPLSAPGERASHHKVEIVRAIQQQRDNLNTQHLRGSLDLPSSAGLETGGVREEGHVSHTRGNLTQQLQSSALLLPRFHCQTREAAARSRHAVNIPVRDWIVGRREDDRDRWGYLLDWADPPVGVRQDDLDGKCDQLGSKRRQRLGSPVLVAGLQRDVAPFDVAEIGQASSERCEVDFG
ncbi:MAG: hypothetical protein U0893_08840 [Chloroflexota bacterium]